MQTQRNLTWILIALTGFCTMMEIVRIVHSHSLSYIFLIWNIILAWIPYLLSLEFTKYDLAARKPRALIILFLWILFLPNGPYLITDLIHLRLRESIPLWYDVLLLSTFAWIGLLLTLLSVRNIHRKLQTYFSPLTLSLGIFLLFISSGFGIYLGRFMRWNSWDVFFRPVYMLHYSILELIHPFHHPRPILVTIIVSTVLSLSYMIFHLISHKPSHNETI